jgi:hypothetical protein
MNALDPDMYRQFRSSGSRSLTTTAYVVVVFTDIDHYQQLQA